MSWTYHGQVSSRVSSQRTETVDEGLTITQHLGRALSSGHAQAQAVTTEERGGGGGGGGGGKAGWGEGLGSG